ncbi:TspO/MBR family protein [Nocardia sp. NPDC050406]|uniref:TspO/MBR family protein n=1 Tax=Nocardia sp. NPDC050406 TaxID=3364318 RepID=UPI003792AD06
MSGTAAQRNSSTDRFEGYSTRTQAIGGAVIVALVIAAAAIGNIAAVNTADKYERLTQPSWAPPSWVFGPVWTVLYALMALSAWWVWRGGPWPLVRTALAAFGVQLALNAAWTPLFFAAEWRGVALVEIVVLTAAIIATIVLFAGRSRFAAGLLVPYLVWTVFATALNFSVWQLNN